MQFKDITGQQAMKGGLIRSAGKGRVSHAQLFAGSEGSGALPLAIAYAQYLSCENPGGDDSCGACVSCRKYRKLAHPDLHFSFPFIAQKKESVAQDYMSQWREAILEQPYITLEKWMKCLNAENKQPNINIAECHSIIQKLSLKPFEAEFKVLIMWLPEYLREVGNSLLKLIEEPPNKTLFLLVSEQPDQLLATLLSRTQLVRINKLQDEDIIQYLLTTGGIEPAMAAQAASLANGNLAAAIDLAAGERNNYGNLFIDWMRLCYQADGLKIVEWVDQIVRYGREDQKNFLRYGLALLRESILHRMGIQGKYKGAESGFVERFSVQLDPDNTASISRELERAIFHIERNANPRILFLDVSLQVMEFLKVGGTRQVSLYRKSKENEERNYGM